MLNMYIGYPSEAKHEVAILIFAHTQREAFRISYLTIMDFGGLDEFIHVRVNRIWAKAPHLLAAADPAKTANDEAHIIDSPPSCDSCCQWGVNIIVQEDGRCSDCHAGIERY